MNQSKTRNEFAARDLVLLFFCATAILLFAFYGNAQTMTFAQQAQLAASDGVLQDGFGFSVAISGDTAIVSGPRNGPSRGAVYIYVRAGSTWTQQQKLIHSDAMGNDQFGYSVAINGNTAAVGRFNTTTGVNRSDGRVYIFTRTGTTWAETQTLVSNDLAQGDVFGSRLAFENDTLVVGAYLKHNGGTSFQGAVYVFTRPAGGGSFTQQAKLLASDGAQFDYFGYSVAVSGDTAVIGAAGQAGFPNSRGKAYVFVRNGSAWSQQQILQASDGVTGDFFGFSVGVDGDTAIMGATGDGTGSITSHGAAYLFVRSGGAWVQQQKITHPDLQTNDLFGTSVAVKGNTALAGAPSYEPDPGVNGQGAIFVFTRSGAMWTQTQRLSQSPVISNALGGSLAYDGSSILTGTFSNSNEIGSAYVFASSPALTARRSFDFDGDGKADLSVFRPSNGTWYINGSTSGFSGIAFGTSGDKIVSADYDGDGKTDVAVYRAGTWYLQRSQAGFTGIGFGAADDIPVPADYDGDGKADITVFRPSNGSWYRINSSNNQFFAVQFGASEDKPTIGDFDGDGKADIAVYRPSNGVWYRINSSNNQVVSVQFGTSEDLVVPADYDGDGKTDVAVFRPSNGTWYLQRSQLGFTGVAFGQSGDKPVPADYDGDGKADVAVYRGGTWYLQRSQTGFLGAAFGASEDLPAPNAFVR